jgi:RNA polymerase sigma-70 factor (ECF subfamily)
VAKHGQAHNRIGAMSEPTRRAPDDLSVGGLEAQMIAYQAGDGAAAEALLGALCPVLGRFFGSMPDSRAAADDLTQETLLRMHRVRHTYRPGEPLMPWIYAIARNARVDHYRRTSRRAAREEAVDPSDLQRYAAPAAPPRDTPGFDALMAHLPESQREVLTMLKVLGLTVEEVARATGSTAGAVKQKAHRAYEKLRGILEGREAPGAVKGEGRIS